MTEPKRVVHLRGVTRTNQHGPYVSGREVARQQDELVRARAEGFTVEDIPDDGRDHPTWPKQGRFGGGPCPICTPRGREEVSS
jgi:hypothetical protein